MNDMSQTLLSVVMPVGPRVDDLQTLIGSYAEALDGAAIRYEFIVVLDGPNEELREPLRALAESISGFKVIEFSRAFGESVALMTGFRESTGDVILTLPPYWQVAPSELTRLIESATDEDEVLISVRWPRMGSGFDRFRREAFHKLLRVITGQSYRDLGCGVRLIKRAVVDEISLYGDQHRFLPILAHRRGFNVREIELAQSPKDKFRGRYRLREYLHRFLDILTVFFLVRFTKKPLRFFGSVGSITAGIGAVFVVVLVFQRLFYGMALADRPALLLASLMIVLGVQLFALGLLGELIIFSHAGDTKEYAIRSVVTASSDDEPAEQPRPKAMGQ